MEDDSLCDSDVDALDEGEEENDVDGDDDSLLDSDDDCEIDDDSLLDSDDDCEIDDDSLLDSEEDSDEENEYDVEQQQAGSMATAPSTINTAPDHSCTEAMIITNIRLTGTLPTNRCR